MFITNSYLGMTKGRHRCLFFLLLEDYIDAQTEFMRVLDPSLERFARNLRDAGALVRPFQGDIEQTRQEVLDKSWSAEELVEIRKTPSLLMMNEDFDTFEPKLHPWIQLNFGQKLDSDMPTLAVLRFGEMLGQLAEAVQGSDEDIFQTAHGLVHEVRHSDAAKVFEAKPGMFGFSINLVEGAELVARLYERLRGSRAKEGS